MQITAENPLAQTKPIVAALDDRPIFDRHLLELAMGFPLLLSVSR